MTTNSINYNKHLEEQQHNRNVEAETRRNNEVVAAETQRHNKAMEEFNIANLVEGITHNRNTEQLSREQLANALTVASIGANARISSARLGAEASMYASDNSFNASIYGSDINSGTVLESTRMRNESAEKINSNSLAFGFLNSSLDRNMRNQIATSDRLSRERTAGKDRAASMLNNVNTNFTSIFNSTARTAGTLIGG